MARETRPLLVDTGAGLRELGAAEFAGEIARQRVVVRRLLALFRAFEQQARRVAFTERIEPESFD